MAIDSLEYQVLSIVRSRMQFLRFSKILREDHFETQQSRYIYKLIENYHEQDKGNIITIRTLRLLLASQVKVVDKPKFRGMVKRIKVNTLTDSKTFERIVKKFAKRQTLKQAIIGAIDALERDEDLDLERVIAKVSEAALMDNQTNIDESYDFFNDPHSRSHDESRENKIPSGLSSVLDNSTTGGLGSGEIAIIIAPTGVGKTLTLVNIGHHAMTLGKKVVYATLEIRSRKLGRRFDMRCSGLTFDGLREEPETLHKKISLLKKRGAGLHIKDYTNSLCSVLDLQAYLERLKSKKFMFDLIIVDHIDLMYSPRQYKEKRYELSSIVASLRRLAGQFNVPIWTASQANRSAGASGRTRLWDIAEDIGKANWADLAIAISQNPQEKEEGIMYFDVVKNRLGSTNPRVKVVVDYPTMTITPIAKGVEDVVGRRKLRD